MKNDAFLQSLGLARRAGRLYFGFDSVVAQQSKLTAVFLSDDLSPKTLKNLYYAFDDKNVNLIAVSYGMSELGYAIGTKPVGIIGVTDAGFAKLLIGKLNREVTE